MPHTPCPRRASHQTTIASADQLARVDRLLADASREAREQRLLARAGDLPERDAGCCSTPPSGEARSARLLALGHSGHATTLELEAWHADPRDAETLAVRADLQDGGLL